MHIKEITYMIVIPFLFVLAIIPFIKGVAKHVGALDIPDARKVHKEPMPRLGGLGIYMGFLLGYIFFGTMSLRMNAILIGSFIIIVTGIVDDIKPIPAKWKFLFQIIAACVVAFYGKILLQDLSAFGFYINFGNFSYLITILFIVAIILLLAYLYIRIDQLLAKRIKQKPWLLPVAWLHRFVIRGTKALKNDRTAQQIRVENTPVTEAVSARVDLFKKLNMI